MKKTERSQSDYLPVIGNTFGTAQTLTDMRWNRYYSLSYSHMVNKMIGGKKGTVLDVGTSHGYWLPFLKKTGFDLILGVELDPQRAQLARQNGYDEVFNCDAANIPHPSATVDVAVSNDVFVHILQLEDKIAVLKEVERLLKPGGIFVLNHTMSRAYGFEEYHIQEYCSFLSLHEFITLAVNNTSLRLIDVKPTYYNFRNVTPGFFTKYLRRLMILPLAAELLFLIDFIYARNLSLEESDTVYIKLAKV